MAEYTKKTKIVTPVFRVSYPHIWKPQKSEDGESDVYSVVMIFDGDADLTPMKKLAKAICTQKFGAEFRPKKKVFKTDFPDIDVKKNPEYEGKTVVSARSYNRKVQVVRRNPSIPKGQPGWLEPIKDESQFYAGCFAMASITCYDYSNQKGGKGVSFGLSNIIKVRDGDPLVNMSNPEDDFEEIDVDEFDDADFDNGDLLADDLDDL